jgi:uncharacterized protein
MPEVSTATATKPTWVDLATSDPEASRDFYSKVFGWRVEVSPDPQYGGYGLAKIDGQDVAGIGPKQSPEAPTAWSLYIHADDVGDLARKVESAGGTVIAPPFDVGDQGRMAVFQDPVGAFISAWQPMAMTPFPTGAANTFGWAELNARGLDSALRFYEDAFGWTHKTDAGGDGAPPYTEFLLDGESIAGALEMSPQIPAEVPSYWTVYFNVDGVDGSYQRALDAGAREMVSPQDFPGGRFAIVSDPQGAMFGLMKVAPR